MVDPAPEGSIKKKNSNEARVSKAVALSGAEIFTFKASCLFVFKLRVSLGYRPESQRVQSSSSAVDTRRGPRPHWTIRSCPLGFQTWCLRSVAGNLFRGDGFAQGKACFSRKGHCFTKVRDHFRSQRAELLRNHGRCCFPCCLTLIHKPNVKY